MGSSGVNEPSKTSLAGLIKLQAVLALLLFLPAWSLRFWEAWIYWMLFGVSMLTITLYFLKHDPSLVERRLEAGPGAEHEKIQKIIQAIASVLVCALIIVPGFDHRFRWSAVPTSIVLSADVMLALGFLMIFFVFKENSYAAGVVKVDAGQHVIETGPYRVVRHPMYAGGLLAVLATPLALGSLCALLAAVPLCGAIVVRLLDEERFLSANLPGYDAYCRTVRYRLVPMVW
jgi:protein-S-isoprenylcysteine O-methyltransferase Ste14